MFYLIDRQTGEVVDKDESKSRLRKLRKEDPTKYKVSRIDNDETADKHNPKDAIVEAKQSNKIAKLRVKYKTLTSLFPDIASLNRFLITLGIVEYEIARHANGSYYAFYERRSKDGKEEKE